MIWYYIGRSIAETEYRNYCIECATERNGLKKKPKNESKPSNNSPVLTRDDNFRRSLYRFVN